MDWRLQCVLWLWTFTCQGVAGLSVVVSPSPTANVVSGQTLSVTCQWSADYTGGNAAVNYKLNDGDGRIGSMLINFGTSCPSAPPYTFICNRGARTMEIQIPATSYSHGDRWTCEGTNNQFDSTTPPQTDTTTVDVIVPVTSVTFTPSTTVTVDVGTSTTLTCTTRPHSRPTASVTWYRVVSGKPQQIAANISVSHDTQNSAQTTTSVLSYVPFKEDDGRAVYCESDGGWTGSTTTTLQSDQVTLNVRYPPTNPLTVTGNSDPVYDGDVMELQCSIRGGNPLASLSWTCPGPSVTSTPTNTVDTAVSLLRITLTPVYNGASCTCTATHPVQSFTRSHTEVFNVYFALQISGLTVTDPFPWLATDDYVGRLSCDTTAGNPSTTRYKWYRDGTLVSSQTSQVISFGPPVSSDDGKVYTCRAENDLTDVRGSPPESDTTLDVQYAPVITLSGCPVAVNETDSYRCTCTAVGKPPPAVTWYPRDSSVNQILDFPAITRNKAGRYTCNATSSSPKFGTLQTQSVLNLVVQYAPDVVLLVQTAQEHDTHLVMTCNASGVPNVYTYGVWTHMYGTTLVRTITGDVTTNGRTLTLDIVSYQDIGTYTCRVQNSITGRDGQLTQTGTSVFDVRGSPRLLKGESLYITEKNQHFNITMTFISHPSPTDMYISNTARLSSTSEIKITFMPGTVSDNIYDKVIPRDGYRVHLDFPSFLINQKGAYSLTVINHVNPNLMYSFQIVIIDVPDTPTNLIADEITTDSAVVSWTPGMNRGRDKQTFHLWIKESSAVDWTKYNTPQTSSGMVISDLQAASTFVVLFFAANEKGRSNNMTLQFKTLSEGDDASLFYQQMYVTSIALICVSVIILLATIGIGIFVTRFGHLPFMKRMVNKPKTTTTHFTNIGDSEHVTTRTPTGQERGLYTELDTTKFAAPNVYEQVRHAHDIAPDDRAERSNYESLDGVSDPNVYDELKEGKGSSSKHIYANTTLSKGT